MIAYLQGKILEITAKSCILLCNNVGYCVHLNKDSLSKIKVNEEAQFYIHNHIREDAFDLYGFASYEALEFFQKLISVKGIGPKAALEILNHPIEQIKSAIINGDDVFIATTPGIGKKTAQRLILELKGKVELGDISGLESASHPSTNEDILSALENLGYQRQHVMGVLKDMPSEIVEDEDVITYFLKNT